MERRIARAVITPPPEPGFIGEGHTAVEVVYSNDLPASDPFVLLMDDRLDDQITGDGASTLTFTAGPRGARIVLYAGEPQHEPLVHHGPFVAGSEAEIYELHRRYRAGGFESMGAIARRARTQTPSTQQEGSAR